MNILKKIFYMSYNNFKNNFINKTDDNNLYLVEVPCVIDFKYDQNSWYRIWSNGWCEQGGYQKPTTNWATITFNKPFTEVPFMLVSESDNTNQNMTDKDGYGVVVAVANITRITARVSCSNKRCFYWEAKGWIDLNQQHVPYTSI